MFKSLILLSSMSLAIIYCIEIPTTIIGEKGVDLLSSYNFLEHGKLYFDKFDPDNYQYESTYNMSDKEVSLSSSIFAKVVEQMRAKMYISDLEYEMYQCDRHNSLWKNSFIKNMINFQKNHSLPEFGFITYSTLEKLFDQKCSISSKTTRQQSKRIENNKSDQFEEYKTYTSNWGKNIIYWKFLNETEIPSLNFTIGEIRLIIDDAFYEWSRVSSLKFIETVEEKYADIKISFRNLEHGDRFPFDGKGPVLAHAFYPDSSYSGEIHIDSDENFRNEESSLYNTVLHEIGHSLGIEHSEDEEAVMFPYAFKYDGRHSLSEDDIMAVTYVYGPKYKPKYTGRKIKPKPYIPPTTTTIKPYIPSTTPKPIKPIYEIINPKINNNGFKTEVLYSPETPKNVINNTLNSLFNFNNLYMSNPVFIMYNHTL